MKCHQCGIDHLDDELELTFKRPDATAEMSEDEREARVQENRDLTVIDGQRFFIRAVLPLPVIGRPNDYALGIWVEVAQAAFERVYALWDQEDQASEPVFAAVLANTVPSLPSTLDLPVTLSLTGPTTPPSLQVLPAEHPLHGEQSAGITPHRIYEYNAFFR